MDVKIMVQLIKVLNIPALWERLLKLVLLFILFILFRLVIYDQDVIKAISKSCVCTKF